MQKRMLFAVSAAVLLASVTAFAQNSPSNLEKLGSMKTTGASPNIPTIPQTGPKAAAIKKNLEKIKLPHGFHVGLYALVPDARHMAVGPQGIVTFVGTRKAQVYAVTDRGKSGVADEVKPFASTIDLILPNGPCFSKDGFLFIAEQNRVLMYPAAEFFYESPDVVAVPIVAQGELIPKEEESYNHTARVCRVGPDNKLYITIGQPFNVPPPEKTDLYKKWGLGGIIRMDRDGKNREVYAWGIRNSVGMDFNPKDKTLWFTDNQVDGMGDDIPPGELNRATKAGQNFGFPVVRRRSCPHRGVQERDAAGRRGVSAGRDGRARGRSRHDLLHRKDVPEEISGRHLLGAARLLEPYRSGRRARDGDLPQRGRHGGKDRAVRGRLARREWRIFGSAGGRRSTEGRLDPGVG